jgi:hypothetical protein
MDWFDIVNKRVLFVGDESAIPLLFLSDMIGNGIIYAKHYETKSERFPFFVFDRCRQSSATHCRSREASSAVDWTSA